MLAALPPVFAGLEAADSQQAAQYFEQIDVATDEVIMLEGEDDQTLAFLVNGSAEIWMGETKIGNAGPRDMLGDMELFYPMPRTCSVTASHGCTLQIVTPEGFAELCELGNPIVYQIERYSIRKLSDRLRSMNDEITHRAGGRSFSLSPKNPSLMQRLFGRRGVEGEVDAHRVLQESEMFKWALPPVVQAIAEHFSLGSYPAETIVCQQGEEGDRMYVIVDGEVEVALMTDASSAETVSRMTRGHAFGDASIVMNSVRSASCIARSDLTTLELDRQRYLELHALDDAVGSAFRQGMIRNLVTQLLATTRRFVALQGTMSAVAEDTEGDVWR